MFCGRRALGSPAQLDNINGRVMPMEKFTIDVEVDDVIVRGDVVPTRAQIAQALQDKVSRLFFDAGSRGFCVESARVRADD